MDGRGSGAARALAWAVATVALLALPATAVAGPPPDPGHAVDDTLTVAQGGNAGLDVTANDVINFGGILLETLTGPAHGRLQGRTGSPGWYQYFPAAGFSGSDSFRYQLTFDDESVSVGTVRIIVTGRTRTTTTTTTTRRVTTTTTGRRPTTTTTSRTTTTTRARSSTTSTGPSSPTTRSTSTASSSARQPPVAADDSAGTDFGTTAVIRVLANDRDPDGTLLPGSVVVVTAPRHGAATVNPDGTISYTSGPDTTALTDTFRYQVSDDSGDRAQATVRIGLREPDDLLGGKTSTSPGAPLHLDGHGCADRERVSLELDGAVAGQAVALADGGFSADLPAPQRLGRYRLRAVCDGHALQSWLDVVQTTSADSGGPAVAAAGALAAVGAVLTFYLLTGFLLIPPAQRRRRWPELVEEIELPGWGRG